ncbi:MAG TPA: hypothetical protein VF557_10800, partial [Jatrophihabitans sp.]|uniref:hypothetical protein n=1 Tax=Jatrophihabitans sp. TaxID=1932789 RepID=UPI002F0126E2
RDSGKGSRTATCYRGVAVHMAGGGAVVAVVVGFGAIGAVAAAARASPNDPALATVRPRPDVPKLLKALLRSLEAELATAGQAAVGTPARSK